ncbi:MAG: hypothetical protein JRI23_30215 [Deltaproteobacteria bacterium]|jgi:hypothetical protein|nr:hypothetical protein [Deltaproteobacteria bacterium]MBW2536444.1 hypothetical protein [Deltaproteobacteria bacterium]
MNRVRWLVGPLAAILSLAAPTSESLAARKKVDWTAVDVRVGDDAKRVARQLRRQLQQASKTADWGKRKEKLALRAQVKVLDWDEREDVVRLKLTVVARIVDGPSARSHIQLGARPAEKRKLERQALRIVAEGLVTRLAEIARKQP